MIDPEPPTPGKFNNLKGQTLLVNSSLEEVTIDCSADGIPTPDITWFKDGDLITVNKQSLFIENLLWEYEF